MKRFLLLTLAAMLFGMAGTYAQPDLNIVWEKDIWPTEIKFAKFSKNGEWIYCAINNTIVKMNPQNGEFVSTFDNTGVSGIYDMDISELGNLIVTHDGGEAVNLWNTSTEKAYKRISLKTETNDESIIAVALSPLETELAFGTIQRYGPHLTDVRTFIVKYDLIKDSVLQRINTDLRISKIKYSHNGKKIAIGGFTFGDNKHNRLELWSADSLKPIATLEDVQGDAEYNKFQFSNDGKYLGSLKMWNFKLFDLETKEMKYFSGNETYCTGFCFYNNNNFIIKVGDASTGLLSINSIHNFDTINTKKYFYPGKIIEQFQIDDRINTYVYGARYHTIYTNQTVGVKEENQFFSIETSNNALTINSIELIKEVKIFDSLGNIIISRNYTSNPQYSTQIEHTLFSGTYICVVTSQDGKTISKSFQVVR